MGGDPLPHGAESVDRGLLEVLVQPAAELLRHRPPDPAVGACGGGQQAGVHPEQGAVGQRLYADIGRPRDQDSNPEYVAIAGVPHCHLTPLRR